MLPDVVTTARVSLPLWDAAVVAALRSGERLPRWHAGFPREDDLDAAGLWHDGDPWGPRSVVVGGWVVGSVGFFGAPEPAADGVAEVEVGYGIVPEGRGRGIVPEAVEALLELTDAAGVRVRASVAPGNTAGMRVAAKLGFTELRGTEDDRLVMVRPLR
ncbi:MAG: GNAT family N-acetyltransferase [Nocardioidaceae bacterium]|nr:GNAT family N-acetyltransferase [Nocardioidaceae bacterium]MCL2613396.1 GNAT family N-acetyltransferase [Nocardioidaceae bacterium]